VALKPARSTTTRLARIGLTAPDHLDAQRQAFDLVREVIPFDAGSFATVDPATVLWTSCVLIGIEPDPVQERGMFENEYRQDDLHKIADLARQPNPAARLSAFDEATRSRSPRYQFLRHHGAIDELRCALVAQGICWGSFEIYRAEASDSFTDDDVQRAATIAKPLAEFVRVVLLNQAASAPESVDEPPGVLVLDESGDIEAKSPTCDAWLEEISVSRHVPAPIRSLAIQVLEKDEASMSMLIPRRSGGWLRVHAIPLTAGSRQTVSVVIEPARPIKLPETVASIYGFTQRERDVISLLARGLSSKEIGDDLGISTFTVNDHIKAAFQKVGVQSRQQLIAVLFFDHCLPLRERDAIPGPYGWFLDEQEPRAVPA
jgi:DNA-binding CsgD family transcriptional regulator